MNILFLSISTAISDLNNRGIYPDLLRYMANQGHEVFIVCPFERRTKKSTTLKEYENVHILGVKTLNITKSNFIEKGIATLVIENQFKWAINKFYKNYKFDLILYTTPPITFNNLISYLKNKFNAKTYLMLKDIFPQNAVDLGLMSKNSITYKYFASKEKQLYKISDFIGCMSPANLNYVIEKNDNLNPNKVGLCPNAIEIIERTKTNSTRIEILNKYNIPSNKTIFLYGGNLGIAQGIDFLIEVLDKLINGEDVFFLIVGGGNQSSKIENWVKMKMPKNTLYIPMLSRSDYDLLESSCDVGMIFLDKRFSIPNFPSRMLAYMEAKLPILIASDNVSDSGIIAEENEFGKFSLAGNYDEFAANLNFFHNNIVKRKQMGENGYKFLKQNYSVEIPYQNIMNVIKNV
jgi:glycosyltransferase involved in cell wall biosynthesis